MSSYAESLTPQQRKKARMQAIGSTLFGCVAEVMLDSSAIITLYIFALGGSGAMTVLAAGLTGLAGMLIYIPCSHFVNKLGLKRAVKYACITGCTGLLLCASGTLFGAAGKYIALLGVFIYSIQRPFYGATWYPLLDNFLRKEDRGSFFGIMRFTYMLSIGIPFFIVGLFMGKEAPILLLQILIAFAGIALLGRWYFINKFPIDPNIQPEVPNIRKALSISLHNGPLVGYSIYVCLFSIAYTPVYPLILAYLKETVKLSAGDVQLISSCWIGGQLIPFLLYGKLLKKTSLATLELTVHFVVVSIALAFFLIPTDTPNFFWIGAIGVLILSMAQSIFMCNNSGELMALARPGNKSMAGAFLQTYQNTGTAIGRNASSAILGAGLLMPGWTLWEMQFNAYQSVFLFCAVIGVVILVLLPVMPSVIPKHDDYYEPPR